MKPSLIAVALERLIEVKQPAFVWGPPGVGKSNVVSQVADKMFGAQAAAAPKKIKPRGALAVAALTVAMGVHFIDLRLPLLDSVDLRGIPVERNEVTKWIPPSFLPSEASIAAGIHAPRGILFLDELPQAMPSVQAAASQLILDRRIGDYILPDGWVIVSAGNRDSDRAATNKMPSHIANRFVHLEMEVHVQDWINWAIDHGVHEMVIGFMNFRRELLHSFDPKRKENATPRTWEFVSRMMIAGIPDEVFLDVLKGTVGEGAAREFVGFVRVFRSLLDYDDIVKNPDTVAVPTDPATLYATITMLAERTAVKHVKSVFTFINRMTKELQLCGVMHMTRKNPELCETLTYIQWSSDNKEILLNAA